MSLLYPVLGLVLAERCGELALAARNTRRLRALGAVEADREGYPLFVLLHGAWLLSLALTVPAKAPASWPLLAVFALLQGARLWVIRTLGRFWTTRVITLPGAPLVRRGPFRYVRHPNYLVVTAEIAILPLAFGAVALALIFSALNMALLARRIRIEQRALAGRPG
ncbi:MAG: hypothetical protein JO038_07550 [Alphaproteobacteria bacterium]|nr:hypothetical protein [Alphaproteobacteria bacterium]